MDEPLSLPTYGGQAVIEGVMMRGTSGVAIAMRAPDKNIVIHTEDLAGIYKSRLVKIPFLRGLVALWDAMGLGIRALTISANTQTGQDEKLEGPQLFFTLAFAIVFAVSLFFVAPAALGHAGESLFNRFSVPAQEAPANPADLPSGLASEGPAPSAEASRNTWSAWAGNLLEGLVRLAFLILYIYLIGLMPEIRRVFAYHGAEHKTINAFEAGAELTPENVARFSLEHPRCGTAFLLTLVLFSVVFFSLLGPLPMEQRLLSRIIALPLLAGVAYEYIRWTARHLSSPVVRFLTRPNLALQHLTTREPDLDMLEVSIAAFNAMRLKESEIRL